MKRFAAIILFLVYFVMSTGFVISVHYCMNKFDSVQLGYDHDDECGKCGMHIEKSGGCCKDSVKLVKMHIDQSFSKISATDFSIAPVAATASIFHSALLQNTLAINHPVAHGPPLSKQDTYLQICVFRI